MWSFPNNAVLSRRIWVLVLATITLGCSGGSKASASSPQPGKSVVVFIDRSQSAGSDRQLYARALGQILNNLKEGDRFVLGAITESSSKDFTKYVDGTLPPPLTRETLMDNELEYKKKLASHNQAVRQAIDDLRSKTETIVKSPSNAANSAIFETLIIASQLFASEKRKKVLVLLSDMIEDSPEANFEKNHIDNSFIQREIQRQRGTGILPDLRDVQLYIAGAHAKSPEQGAAIQHFWAQYFQATGATLKPGHYSRTLFSFDE